MPLLHALVRRITGPKCPVSRDQKQWIEERMRWLQREFGPNRTDVPVLQPTLQMFPRTWNGTPAESEELLRNLCEYMEVPRTSVSVNFYRGTQDPLRHHMHTYESSESGAAGMYHGRTKDGVFVISLAVEQLKRPVSLVSTICHELGHALLLGDGKLRGDEQDHEPLTDLLTVFFGAGIFTANAAFEFEQWQNGQMQGWRTSRHGYLNEPQLAYALACYAWLRNEEKPKWRTHLAGNITPHFDDAMHYVATTRDITLLRDVSRPAQPSTVWSTPPSPAESIGSER